jgi:hypothetical protein
LRIQSQILIALICFNAAIAFVDTLGIIGVLPGYNFAHGLGTNSTDYNGAMVQYGNATDMATSWSQNPPTAIGVIGDIVGSLPSYFKIVIDLIGGFPILIIQLSNMFALDATGALVIAALATFLATPFGFLMFSYIVEWISGRSQND